MGSSGDTSEGKSETAAFFGDIDDRIPGLNERDRSAHLLREDHHQRVLRRIVQRPGDRRDLL